MKIYYGIIENCIDVTNICFEKLVNNNIIIIPNGDYNRANYFTDPLYGIHKKIIINKDDMITEYDELTQIKINIIDNTITTIDENYVNNKINHIHSSLKINNGNFTEELPEQKMVVRYLTGNEKVLEIGGNIGRNSLIIASILHNQSNLVTLESNVIIANQLIENKNLNGYNFQVESSALSNRKLIQKGWDTIPSEILQDGYTWVNTITLNQLELKYCIIFDTLVLDCEGAFYYILLDMPEILDNINLIIMENDYQDLTHKLFIDDVLILNNFSRNYVESGVWGPCFNNFYEVWIKCVI